MDARLRNLERAALRGDVDAQTALLVARVRAGTISEDRVRLAAYLGDDIASEARGFLGFKTSKYPRRWLRGIAKHGEDVSARVVLICHDVLINGHVNIPQDVGSKRTWGRARYMNFGRMTLVYDAVEAWISEPTNDNFFQAELRQIEYTQWRDDLHPWDARSVPEHHLMTIPRGTASVHIEESFKIACAHRNPSCSKWGIKQVEMVLKCLITGQLIPWALQRD